MVLINLVAFNLCWLGLVLIGNQFIPIALLWLFLHFYYQRQRGRELRLMLCVTLMGAGIDSLLSLLDVFRFDDVLIVPLFSPLFIPLWLFVLWLCFAATLNHAMRFMAHNKCWQMLAGMLAPLSYFAGEKLGKVELPLGLLFSYLLLATIWIVHMLTFFYWRKIFIEDDGIVHNDSQ